MSELTLARFKCCTKCECTKPATFAFFSPKRGGRLGVDAQCKICRKCWRDGRKAQRKIWAARHYRANRERLLEEQRRYREVNGEKFRAGLRKHYANNRDWYLERATRNKARRAGAEGTHTRAEVKRMYEDQGGLCAYCEVPLDGSFQVDHMMPLIRGGRNDWTNLAVSCAFCNNSKHAKTAEEFMAVLME